MNRKSSLKRKLIIGIFLGYIIPYFLGGIYLKSFVDDWLYKHNLEHTDKLLLQVGELIDQSLINDVSDMVNMLSQDDRVKMIDESINNYTKYDRETYVYKNSEMEQLVERYFKTVKESHKEVNFIFFGSESGGYIEYPRFQPNTLYDPTQRPWYKNTIHTDQVTISEPYISQVTQEMIISFTKRVDLEDKTIGVVGISVKVEDLIQSIGNIKLGETGYILVLNENDKIIVGPKDKGWILKTPGELELNPLLHLESNTGKAFEGVLEDEEKVIHAYVSPISGWKFAGIISKDEILKESKDITNIFYGIYVLTLFTVFVMVYMVSNRITEPILSIAALINKMANFDLTAYRNSKMNAYTKRKDEIGIIASALAGMHENFTELVHRISEMDDEIKQIDIREDACYRLTLSDKNPFHNVTQSINVLLEKTQSYLEQLKESNREILEKNELLTASEEELLAQLDEINSQKRHIDFLAFHDPLTNLPNRRKFIDKLKYVLSQNVNGAVLLLDIDNFKGINDTLGHVFGDKVLEEMSKRMESLADERVFISRFGGDEFLILLENEADSDGTLHFINALYDLFDESIQVDNHELEIRFSIGISLFPQDSQDFNQLIMNADLALYTVKNAGKNGYRFFDLSMIEHLQRRSEVERVIKDAMENEGFKMVYQPQIHLLTGEVYAYEALLRLRDHTISPAEFIPIAEDNGSIIRIGRIAVQQVIRQINQWQRKGFPVKPVSINFSAKQLHDEDFLQFISDELENCQVSPKYIEIEITENVFLENKEATLVFLRQLKKAGIKISIDDFGTGYSSLSYLTFLPIDKIKLDRTLNLRFLEIENIRVMESLIALSHSLNLEVVAEGIETYEQVRRLQAGKCDYIQGYFFSKPMETEEVEASFSKNYFRP